MLTDVELLHLDGRIERWIRFGKPVAERLVDRRRRVVSFAPDAIFCLVRWQAGEHGTAVSRIDILRAVRPGEAFTTLPYVAPGGELLLHVQGWPKVQKVLGAIDAVEALGVSAREVSPDHWRCVQNRLAAGEAPRPYCLRRHRAWLLRRGLAGVA
ncbi:DUF2840 domain-containing protein [Phenylobacterium sp.]|uniref:DUF2840 domain-containing protein n=1 Tax=Phenylobacterium sp. TaxID=1871053 RepID=UPI002FE37C59